jgi:hypothetical protein
MWRGKKCNDVYLMSRNSNSTLSRGTALAVLWQNKPSFTSQNIPHFECASTPESCRGTGDDQLMAQLAVALQRVRAAASLLQGAAALHDGGAGASSFSLSDVTCGTAALVSHRKGNLSNLLGITVELPC